MILTQRYKDQIDGILSCYDRIIIHGNIPGWCYASGMTGYLYSKKIRIFDYQKFALKLRDEIRENTRRIAGENNIEIEHIKKIKAFRKEKRIKEIIKERGDHPGLVHIFSAMESCASYRPWHNKETGKTYLRPDSSKCLHYYFYFIDEKLGLCYMRVPTWCPFRLQFYFNGHNWLSYKLKKKGIGHEIRDNGFLKIEDFRTAQDLSDGFRAEDLHHALDAFASRYCPVVGLYGQTYRWSIMQAEYSTDILFKNQENLKYLYEPLVRTAIHSVKPDNIASFLGRKVDPRYQGEMGNNFNTRILGTRIKHRMGAVSIKMYDKFGIILRIETTANDVSHFKHLRKVQQRDGTIVERVAPMKKNIYSLFPLMRIMKASNRRYLEFISTFDDMSGGIRKLKKVTETVKSEDRSYRGFNFYSEEDQNLFEVLCRGEFNISGFQNKSIRAHLSDKSSGTISRILKRLKVHGLIKKVSNTYKYYLTKFGKKVITVGLAIKEMLVTPLLAGLSTAYG